MKTLGDNQFTKEQSDMYVSEFAEEGLDERNPFKQATTDQPIADANDAAIAAVLSRSEESAERPIEPTEQGLPTEKRKAQSAASQTEEIPTPQVDEARFDGLFSPAPNSAVVASTSADTQEDHSLDRKHRRSSSKGSPNPLLDAIATDAVNDDDDDPEVQRLIKRARQDSRTLLIRPGDNERDEDNKMRANSDMRSTAYREDEEDDNVKGNSDRSEQEVDYAAGDEADRPTEAKPMTLMEKLSEHKDHDPIPRDPGDEDDDIEAKEGDDYDAENYEKFEDDQDGMGETVAEDGPDMDERLLV